MSAIIKNLKVGDLFCFSLYDLNGEVIPISSVWIRGKYDRSKKRYSCKRLNDFATEYFFNGYRIVHTDFKF